MLRDIELDGGDGRPRIATFEPGEFIGRWCERTSSFELRTPPSSPPAQPAVRGILGDLSVIVLALLVIFSVPGLIVYAVMR